MTAIYKMTYNKIMFDKNAGRNLEKYVVIVNNLYKAKQLTEKVNAISFDIRICRITLLNFIIMKGE